MGTGGAGESQDHANQVVAAVDGSDTSRAALAWAVREAGRTGRSVVAVRVFDPRFLFSPPAPVFQSHAAALDDERAALDGSVAETVGSPEGLTAELLEGDPAAELVRRSAGAALLVLGSHGHGRIGTSVLGSVGSACVRRASCPVLFIPHRIAPTVLGGSASAGDARAGSTS